MAKLVRYLGDYVCKYRATEFNHVCKFGVCAIGPKQKPNGNCNYCKAMGVYRANGHKGVCGKTYGYPKKWYSTGGFRLNGNRYTC